MFSYGTLTPATYNSVGSTPTPTYNVLWYGLSKNYPVNGINISTDGITWTTINGVSSSGSNTGNPYTSMLDYKKELFRFNGKLYSITNNNVTTKTIANNAFGWVNGFGAQMIWDNYRQIWLSSSPTTGSNYGGKIAINTTDYLSSAGSNSKKFNTSVPYDYPITDGNGNVFIYAYGRSGYNYFLPSGQHPTSGTWTNKHRDMESALTSAGVSSAFVLGGIYFPNVGFVFAVPYGCAIYNVANNTWTASSVGWSMPNSQKVYMQYDPQKSIIYAKSSSNSGVYYSNDGLNWNSLNYTETSNTTGIAAAGDVVIVTVGNGYYEYKYSTNSWSTYKASLSNGDGFYNTQMNIGCIFYTD